MRSDEPLLFELSRPGRRAWSLPESDVPGEGAEGLIPAGRRRSGPPGLPEVAEVGVVRHFTRLSRRNHAVDTGFYPLGSCTMKYNPRVNEDAARLPGFSGLHPYTPEEMSQGAMQLMWELERYLCEISGMARASLQPAAGAQGELAGLLMIRAWHEHRGDKRTRVIVPDSAHGTNPASATMCGYEVVPVRSDDRGGVDLADLERLVDPSMAALMLTNPNTLGLFDENIDRIAGMVHEAGGLLYYDGANMNAIMGITRPGDMGFDVVHLNLHKTFAAPHGGGGPGSGVVGVKEPLVPYLPGPLVERRDAGDGPRFRWSDGSPLSIGRVHTFHGNFSVLVRTYTYIRMLGPEGLKQVSEDAVLSANYLMCLLWNVLEVPYDRSCMHEFVVSARRLKEETGVRALDIAKRLLDHGIHPPTVYFPLIVEEALMIEPTETESKEILDEFVSVMEGIVAEALAEPEKVKGAPWVCAVSRLDEALAARRPDLRWHPPAH